MQIFKAMMKDEPVELQAFYFPGTKLPYRVQWYDLEDHVYIAGNRMWPEDKRVSWALFIVNELKIPHLTTDVILKSLPDHPVVGQVKP